MIHSPSLENNCLPDFIENIQSQVVMSVQCATKILLRVQSSLSGDRLTSIRDKVIKEIFSFQNLLLNGILFMLLSEAQI